MNMDAIIIDAQTCTHDYDPHGCCRRCGHLKPSGIAHQEAMENKQRRETMDRLQEMFRNAEAKFTCNQKNGGVCCFNGFCELHKQHELARYLVNHGVQIGPTMVDPKTPLSLAELRQMQGDPVWVCDQGGKGIPVCGIIHNNCIVFASGSVIWLDENAGDVKCGSWWFAYRHKPQEG